jgi:chromosome partitioning protein
MAFENAMRGNSARVIVVANEKGGSGKSTVAMNIAIALMKSGQRVATIDLDARQKSFTSYIENRRAWAAHVGQELEIPEHVCLDETVNFPSTEERAAGSKALTEAVERLSQTSDVIVIDSPGQDSYLSRLAHSMADTLVTPLNDSFLDFASLGTIDPASLTLTGIGPYATMVEEARSQRQLLDRRPTDWIVLRNRLSMVNSRNKRQMAEMLDELSQRLNFRLVEGLAERLIFREFYPRGLTAVDELDRRTLGTRPTMSHATARLEIENLVREIMGLGEVAADYQPEAVIQDRDAA